MRIYLASLNSGMSKELFEQSLSKIKPLYALETFFNGKIKCKKVMSIVGGDNFLLDSGAFSYMNGQKTTLEQMRNYLNNYIDFINNHDVKYFFELDVDNIFGLKQVEEWRNLLEKETNRQCIPVWHKGRGIEYWKRMCADYRYVAIGGLVFHVKKSEYPLIRKMTDYAYGRGIKVHGLGFTKKKEIENYKFYSVDSATWTIGAALGRQRHDFIGNELRCRKITIPGKKKLGHLVSHNYIEWCKYQRYMDKK